MKSSLFDTLSNLDRSRLAIVSSAGTLTIGEFLDLAQARYRVQKDSISTRVVKSGDNVCECLADFVSLDGRVPYFFLIPRNYDVSLIDRANIARSEADLRFGFTGITRWIMVTSGTTGEPKFVGHTFHTISRTAKRSGAIGRNHRWALMYDPCRFAGLQVVIQSLLAESVLLIPPLEDIDECVSFLVDHRCTSISATPSMWRKLVTAKDLRKLELRQITLGGEIADDKILRSLRHLFPTSRIAHVYASTEAGTAFSVRDGFAGFPLSYLNAQNEFGVQLKIGENGILHIKAQNQQQEYVGHSERLFDSEGYINTGDLVEVREDRVYFVGRANGTINVGGIKVSPEEVEAVIRDCDNVLEAFVYGKPNPILGYVVAADVVANAQCDIAELRSRILECCGKRLNAHARPAIIRLVERIDLSGAGKIARKRM